MPADEREDLITNLTTARDACEPQIQAKMIWHFTQCDASFGERIATGLRASAGVDAHEPIGAA